MTPDMATREREAWMAGARWMYWATLRDGVGFYARMTGVERANLLDLASRADPSGQTFLPEQFRASEARAANRHPPTPTPRTP